MKSLSPKIQVLIVAVVLLGCTFGAYFSSLQGGFVWDDRPLILDDPSVRSLSNWPTAFARDFFAHDEDGFKYGYYRPVITLTYMADWAVAQNRAWFFHLVNLLWHWGVSLLFFMIARRILSGRFYGPFAAACVFTVHPIHTESVSWISGRTDVVCTFFAMLCLWFAMDFLDRLGVRETALEQAAKRKKKKAQAVEPVPKFGAILSTVFFAAALFSKEMAVVAPASVLLYGIYFSHKDRRRSLVSAWGLFAGYAAVVIVYGIFRFGLAEVQSMATLPVAHSFLHAMFTAPAAFALYLYKMILPISLAAYYVFPYMTSPLHLLPIIGLTILGGLVWMLFVFGSKRPSFGFFLSFFLVSFLPLANLVRISAPGDMGFPVAERFVYMPSLALLGIFAWALSQVLDTEKPIKGLVVGAVISCLLIVAVFGARTFVRGLDYKNDYRFFKKAYEGAPESPLVLVAWGNQLRKAGKIKRAIKILEKGREINERERYIEFTSLYNNLGIAYGTSGDLEKALGYLKKAEETGKNRSTVYMNLGELYRLKKDYRTSVTYLSKALELRPESNKALSMRAQNKMNLKDYAGALTDLTTLARLYPEDTEVLVNIGVVYRNSKQFDKAIAPLSEAVRRRPDDVRALVLLGTLLAHMNKMNDALGYLSRAYTLQPEGIEEGGAYGAALFRTGNKEKAKEIFQKLVDLHPNDVRPYLNLVNFHFESGNKPEAEKWLAKAESVAPKDPIVLQYRKAL